MMIYFIIYLYNIYLHHKREFFMAKKENKFKGYDISTQAVHTGAGYDAETGAVRRPLHMANSYKLPDDLSKVNYSSTDLLMYARNGNPNQHWLEEKVAALHGADDAIVLGSGVAALHALFWTLLKTENVTFVSYPGLASHPGHELAKKQMKHGFGGVISFGIAADDKAVERFCAALKVVTFAVSLGHDESLIFPQPSYDERINLYPEKFRKGFIRFSIGLEDPDDIIGDLDQALKAIGL